MDSVIVSAFIYLNKGSFKTLETYLNYGKSLIELKIHKIIFMDASLIHLFENDEYTTFISTSLEEIYLYQYKTECTNLEKVYKDERKDSFDYFIIQNNKTEWMRQAIDMDMYKATNYIWVDFGIFHIFKNDIPYDFHTLVSKHYSQVRISSIWNTTNNKIVINWNLNEFKNILWYFCGGIFGGDKNSLIQFADLTREKCNYVIKEYRLLLWEVNIWYFVYLDHPHLFDMYYVDNHNERMITEYYENKQTFFSPYYIK
jgi:hypothetical protein